MTRFTQRLLQASFPLILLLFIFASTGAKAQDTSTHELVFIRIEIMGLACPYCAFGMEKELKRISGVDAVEIELKEGLAYLSTPIEQKPSKESIRKIIVDAGFTPGEIDFSNHPFDKTSIKKKK